VGGWQHEKDEAERDDLAQPLLGEPLVEAPKTRRQPVQEMPPREIAQREPRDEDDEERRPDGADVRGHERRRQRPDERRGEDEEHGGQMDQLPESEGHDEEDRTERARSANRSSDLLGMELLRETARPRGDDETEQHHREDGLHVHG
jgi:hypothetical protein